MEGFCVTGLGGGLYLEGLIFGILRYFVSLSHMFLDKKSLLKIWLNPGLNVTIFRGTLPCFFPSPLALSLQIIIIFFSQP